MDQRLKYKKLKYKNKKYKNIQKHRRKHMYIYPSARNAFIQMQEI